MEQKFTVKTHNYLINKKRGKISHSPVNGNENLINSDGLINGVNSLLAIRMEKKKQRAASR